MMNGRLEKRMGKFDDLVLSHESLKARYELNRHRVKQWNCHPLKIVVETDRSTWNEFHGLAKNSDVVHFKVITVPIQNGGDEDRYRRQIPPPSFTVDLSSQSVVNYLPLLASTIAVSASCGASCWHKTAQAS
jgi:hypothetical protein